MAPAKKAAKKSSKKTAKKTNAKKTAGKKTGAKKTNAKKSAKKSSAKKAAKRTTAASQDNVVVASKLREAVRGQDIRMSGDFAAALNAEVHDLVTRAVRRAKDNNRGTVRPSDL